MTEFSDNYFEVSGGRVRPIREFIESLYRGPLPKTVEDLKVFLHNIERYRNIIPEYCHVILPLKICVKASEGFSATADYCTRLKILLEQILIHGWVRTVDSAQPVILVFNIRNLICSRTLMQLISDRKTPVWYKGFLIPHVFKHRSSDYVNSFVLYKLLLRLRSIIGTRDKLVVVMDVHLLDYLNNPRNRRTPISTWRNKIMEANLTVMSPEVFEGLG